MPQQWMLAISIGPVGHFIAAGRRSRDLWWGSTWLSMLVQELARYAKQHGTLILPRPDTVTNADNLTSKHGGRVANKLLIRVSGEETEVAILAADLRTLAHTWLADRVCPALDRARDVIGEESRFIAQVKAIAAGDFVEFRAGWVLDTGDFQTCVKEARRRCDATPRIFRRPKSWEGSSKCDLDPGRDNVLSEKNTAQRARLGIRESEALDALYLARRLDFFTSVAPGKRPFPPLARVAMEPWLLGAQRARRGVLDWIIAQLDAAKASEDFFAWCSPAMNPCDDSGANFPFDSSFMLEGEVDARSLEMGRQGLEPNALLALRPAIQRLHAQCGAPIPYYALIEMDGDGVGAELAKLEETSWELAIDALNTFSSNAIGMLAKHGAVAFYAAGDELLLYAPVDTALALVKDLVDAWKDGPQLRLSSTSLSAGVVFAHVKDDLTATRHAAHAALSAAKDARAGDGVAYLRVEERPRGGAPRGLTGPLLKLTAELIARATALDERGDDPLSLRTAHILDEHIQRLDPSEASVTLAQGALIRQIGKPKDSEPTGRPALRETVLGLKTREDMEAMRDSLLIAARVGRVASQREVRS